MNGCRDIITFFWNRPSRINWLAWWLHNNKIIIVNSIPRLILRVISLHNLAMQRFWTCWSHVDLCWQVSFRHIWLIVVLCGDSTVFDKRKPRSDKSQTKLNEWIITHCLHFNCRRCRQDPSIALSRLKTSTLTISHGVPFLGKAYKNQTLFCEPVYSTQLNLSGSLGHVRS